MEDINELLKDAIVCDDFHFLETNKHIYDINHRFSDEYNDTLLSYAISYEGSHSYSFFLDNGADITLINDDGENIIHSIVFSGVVERLTEILNKHPSAINLINDKSNDGTTPLLLSVVLEKYDIFDLLLRLNADVNIVDNEGNAPIHPACSLGYKDMVYKLIDHGANLHVKTEKGNYPLALAINEDHDEITKYLFSILYK
jgi:ankyrin repeat protein